MLTTAQQQHWQDLVEEQLSRGTLYLDFADGKDWYCFVPPDQHDELIEEVEKWFHGHLPEESMVRTHPANWLGFLVPIDEVDRIGIAALRRETNVLTRFHHAFNWRLYQYQVAVTLQEMPAVAPVLAGLWHYCWQYAAVLASAWRERADLVPLLRELPGATPFAERLPTEQCLEILLFLCRRPFHHLWEEADLLAMINAAHPAVRAYLLQYRTVLESALVTHRPELIRQAAPAFFDLSRVDLPLVAAQALLTNQAIMTVPPALHLQLDEKRKRKASGTARAVRRGYNRLRRLLTVAATAPASAPLFYPDFQPLRAADETSWCELEPTVLEEIAALETGSAAVRVAWEDYLVQVVRHFTHPCLRWEKKHENYRPEWHLPAPDLARATHRAYTDRLALEAEETVRLEELLRQLARVPTLAGLRTFTDRVPHFRSPAVAIRWQQAQSEHREQLKRRGEYRTQRMREFGLLDVAESEHRKQLWLEELLQIEEEVRPYLSYVRKAFQVALPVGSTVDFDPYRHRHDGIEFDPETLTDQNKWLRGEVMKTLRSKRNFAPITQVNTLCLDYSRSMTHHLMRDLFKVVFLLVTGLEGRRSYDAIHFFGSDFYEVVNFGDSNKFTSRNVLFRVLRNIAEVHTHKVVYGGEGGTNISAGVEKSCAKLKTFTAQLKAEQPTMNFVSSLFVLTDGQPTLGIHNLDELRDFIESKRAGGEVAIKGIYLKPANEDTDFMARIFGPDHAVEATTFEETVRTFVQLMSRTYQDQRKHFRNAEKRRKMQGQFSPPE